MRNLTRYLRPALTGTLIVLALASAAQLAYGENALDLSLAHLDDGGCADPALIAQVGYLHSAGPREARATVNVDPAGNDCRQRDVEYDLNVSHAVSLQAGWNLVFKAQAAERAVSAAYELLGEDGQVLTRPDGGALFSPLLPAGAARTVGAIASLGRDTPLGRIRVGYNAVPIAWAMYDAGTTMHVSWQAAAGEFTFGVDVDAGEATFGDARIGWSRGPAQCSIQYAWGLSAIDAGAPAEQLVDGAMFRLGGPARDDSARVGCGVRLAL